MPIDALPINDKNLNSEIETYMMQSLTICSAVTINDKNLNSEIETMGWVICHLCAITTINDKNLNSEIETDTAQTRKTIKSYLSTIRISILRLKP